MEINQNQFWHTFNLCGVTFDAKCSDAFQLQLHFFKFISTFQLQLELSNCRVIFKLQKKISNFARLFPTSLDYFQLRSIISNLDRNFPTPRSFQLHVSLWCFNVTMFSMLCLFGKYLECTSAIKRENASQMSAYFLTFWSCSGLVNNYDLLSRTFIMINFDHAVHIQ